MENRNYTNPQFALKLAIESDYNWNDKTKYFELAEKYLNWLNEMDKKNGTI